MRKYFIILLPSILQFGCPVKAQPPVADSNTYAIIDVNLISMKDSSILPNQTVLVQGEKIIRTGTSNAVKVPTHFTRIDGKDKYLLPGICDMHIHLPYNDKDTAAIPGMLKLLVANGVTTVLNLLGLPIHLDIRNKINKGLLLGPTIFTSGFFINQPFVKTPQQVDSSIMAQKKAGYDVLKFHNPLSASAFHRLNAKAKEENMIMVGHLPRNLGVEVAISEGQKVIAHAEEFIYSYLVFNRTPASAREVDSLLSAIATRIAEEDIMVMPTLNVYRNIIPQVRNLDSVLKLPEMQYVPREIFESFRPEVNMYANPPFDKKNIETYENVYRAQEILVKKLNDAGVILVFGTDCPVSAQVPGFSVRDEMDAMAKAGLSPYAIIKSATINAAILMRRENEFGTIEEGKAANMILVNKNPFDDIKNITQQSGVMVRGRWLDKKSLDEMLLTLNQNK